MDREEKRGLQTDISEICKVLDRNPIDNIKTLIGMIIEYLRLREEIVENDKFEKH